MVRKGGEGGKSAHQFSAPHNPLRQLHFSLLSVFCIFHWGGGQGRGVPVTYLLKKVLKSLIWLTSVFNRGNWGLGSLRNWPLISHLIREKAQVSKLPVHPALRHPIIAALQKSSASVLYLAHQSLGWHFAGHFGLAADAPNAHLYCNSRDSWNLFLVPASACKYLTHALSCILWRPPWVSALYLHVV